METLPQALNKDLILRERLALQRTLMANQSTLLSFIRTALYFLIAGLSIQAIFKLQNVDVLRDFLFLSSFALLISGIYNYYRQKGRMKESEKHIGNYRMDYLN